MRRTALLGLALSLPGCTGTGEFLRHVHSPPPANPNAPSADSLNLRRVLGAAPDAAPLQVEPGNVWPDQRRQEPTLADLQQNPAATTGDPAEVPGRPPGLPAGRQPRPRGSSTPPVAPEPPAPPPRPGVLPQPPITGAPPRDPTGSVVQTPGGPAVDAGGTSGYRQLLTPRGPGAIVVPNGNGTNTIINPDGSVQVVPIPR